MSLFSEDLVKPIPGQASTLHDSDSLRLGHSSPPPSLGVVTALVLFLVPPPQELLHMPHGIQPDTAQSTENHELSLCLHLCCINPFSQSIGVIQY